MTAAINASATGRKKIKEPEVALSKDGSKLRLAGSALGLITAMSIAMTAWTVNLFVGYLERHQQNENEALRRIEEQNDKVSGMRIDQCHQIQSEAIEAIERSRLSAESQSDLLKTFIGTINRLEDHMEEQTEELREINKTLLGR